MALTLPNLDDRTFEQLIEDAKRVLEVQCPGWTNPSPSDPGIVLLEVFAHLTEVMLYRLNRLPEKAYIEFLRLIDVTLQPPVAAEVELCFSRTGDTDHRIDVPRGTRVTVARASSGIEPPVFMTVRHQILEPGIKEATVLARHGDLIEGDLAGVGTGLPGLSVTVGFPPIVASTGDDLDLRVGVEVGHERIDADVTTNWNGKTFRLWREVDHFINLGPDRFVYRVDRMTGTITFAPALRMRQDNGQLQATPEALAEVPPFGQEIRVWYLCGGGPEGNVSAGMLTVLKDPIPGLQVVNRATATGGLAAETLDNALLRGPQELRLLGRAVTAEDYEMHAIRASGAIARAKAFTQASMWRHATPGTVEVLLVPHVPEHKREHGLITVAMLRAEQEATARERVQRVLDERCPLGTRCVVNWARYKIVHVKARVVAQRGENPTDIRKRVQDRLHERVNPLPASPHRSGWPFGRALHVSQVYEMALAEPGVSRLEDVSVLVDEAPGKDVASLAADPTQPNTWYAGSGNVLFRSVNNGEGWEAVRHFPEHEPEQEVVKVIRVHADRPGLLAAVTHQRGSGADITARVYLSWDCGETWEERPIPLQQFEVHDMAWMVRADLPVLLLATSVGLYEITMRDEGRTPEQIIVDQDQPPNLGFYSVAAATVGNERIIAVAAQQQSGVYLRVEDPIPRPFELSGLRNEDVRVLLFQQEGARTLFWAGVYAAGADEGIGCFRMEYQGRDTARDAWVPVSENWQGGSCRTLTILVSTVLAGTHQAGALWLAGNAWQPSRPNLDCGLPLLGEGGRLFHRVDTLASDPQGRFLLAAGPAGIFRSRDGGQTYKNCAKHEFHDRVALPETWLLCSGEHDIEVVSEDDTNRD